MAGRMEFEYGFKGSGAGNGGRSSSGVSRRGSLRVGPLHSRRAGDKPGSGRQIRGVRDQILTPRDEPAPHTKRIEILSAALRPVACILHHEFTKQHCHGFATR